MGENLSQVILDVIPDIFNYKLQTQFVFLSFFVLFSCYLFVLFVLPFSNYLIFVYEVWSSLGIKR